MKGYLGEKIIDISKTKFAMYSKNDWAMKWIEDYGNIDGDHHKAWLLDQIARILKGSKIIVKLATWESRHQEYRFDIEETTKEYKDWVREMKNGEDGENTYSYNCGIAP